MKATEFRIGNLVYFTNPHSDRIVIEIEEIKIDYDYFEPIPITEEWLVEFGFEKLTGCNVLENCYHKNGYSVSFDKCGSITFWVSDEKTIIIEFIHTIQNLYFALTGEELTTNNLFESKSELKREIRFLNMKNEYNELEISSLENENETLKAENEKILKENNELRLELSRLKSFFELPKQSSLVENFMTMKYEQRCENLEAKLKQLSGRFEALINSPIFSDIIKNNKQL